MITTVLDLRDDVKHCDNKLDEALNRLIIQANIDKKVIEKEQCKLLVDYIQDLIKQKNILENINGRLNYKLTTLKESYKDLIDRV
ncbi:MAG: hypothetical protein IJV31_08040 [Clostridia bacterium]|nr:hypothetical protein [Clostridia bacterium]